MTAAQTTPEHAAAGPAAQLASAEAFVIVGDKDDVAGAGLRTATGATGPTRPRRALAEIGDPRDFRERPGKYGGLLLALRPRALPPGST